MNFKKDDYKELIEAAREYCEDNEFIDSVVNFYDEKGFITPKQEAALVRAIGNEKMYEGGGGFNQYFTENNKD
jgi:hypothetical protein